jgi:hypothetical protein
MKKIVLLVVISFLISIGTSAQQAGPITIEKKGIRKSYVQDGKPLDAKQLASVLGSDQASAKALQSSKTNSYVAVSSIGAGTVFIGIGFVYTLKAAQATNDNDLAGSTDYSNKSAGAMLIGAGFYAASVPFLLMSNSHLKKSINLYNSSRKTSSINKIDLNIGFTGNRATVQLRF